jgi:hypothetical protein
MGLGNLLASLNCRVVSVPAPGDVLVYDLGWLRVGPLQPDETIMQIRTGTHTDDPSAMGVRRSAEEMHAMESIEARMDQTVTTLTRDMR